MDVISTTIGIIGCLTGIIGVCIAQRANHHSKIANELSEIASTRAVEANGIAKQANDLAQEANTISTKALNAAQDRIDYVWVCEVDPSLKTVSVTNSGAWPAHNVSLTIEKDGETIRHIDGCEWAAGEKITIPIENEIDKFFEAVHTLSIPRPAVSSEGVFYGGKSGDPVECVFTARVRFETPQGVKRGDVIEQSLRYCVKNGGSFKRLR